VYIIGGGAVVGAFLLWAFVIEPGQTKLAADEAAIERDSKNRDMLVAKAAKRAGLETERVKLNEAYSNQIDKIGDMRIPANIRDILAVQCDNIDKEYGSRIGATRFPPIDTNETFYHQMKYGLSKVQCDWVSLNAVLYLIENSGQLVGFDTLILNADPRDPNNVKVTADMNVKSFIFPDRGKRPWELPDFTEVKEDLNPDIFQLPPSMRPKGPAPPITGVVGDQLPPWTRSIKLTGIWQTPSGEPQAVFYDQSKQKTQVVSVGSVISNTASAMSSGAVVKSIDFYAGKVTCEENGQPYELPLRGDYARGMYQAPKAMSFDVGRPGSPASRSQVPGVALGPLASAGSASPPEREEQPEQRQATNVVAAEKVPVPADYDKPLGSFSDCQLKLGVFLVPIDEYVQRRYRLSANHGMLIVRINKVGPATKAGILRGDIITGVGGKSVDSRETFTYLLNEMAKQSDVVQVQVVRGGQPQTLNVDMKQQ